MDPRPLTSRFTLLIITLLFGACTGTYQVREESRLNPNTAQAVFTQKDRWVDRTLSGMTLSEKVGQMIVASIEGQYRGNNDKEFLKISRLTEEGKIGGIMFLKGDVMGAGMLANHFQSVSKVPLLVSADMERGVAMRLEGATEFAPAMAVAATADSTLAQAMSAVIAREARAVGISQDYAPSADLNINPANPVINTRSFGDRIPLVIDMSSAVIDGLQSNGVAATVKHFPGHGDVTVDSHKALPILEGDRQRLDQYELKPFRAAIDRGVMSVMVGHLAVPKLTGSLEPASLSKTIVTDLLRKELGFTGVIVTDAMNMKALYNGSNLAEISVKAVQAGNDILLFPPDPELMHDAVVTAVEQGTISESRIDDSVRRILKLKRWLGLDRNKLSDLTRLQEKVRQPESLQLADKITRNSVTIIRDRNQLVPLRLPLNGQVLNIVLQDRQREENSRPFAEMLGQNHTVLQFRLTPTSNEQTIQEVANLAAGASAVIITTEVQATNNSILSKLSDRQIEFVRTLPSKLPLGTPVMLISFGPPYLLDEFPEIGTAICAYSSSQQAEDAVVRVLNGQITPTGKLPVTLRTSQP